MTTFKKFNSCFFATIFLILTASNQICMAQCDPVLEGPHSMCTFINSNSNQTYTIANYSATATYNIYTVQGVNTYPICTGTCGNTFTSNFPVFTSPGMVIVQVTAPCTGADTIFVQECCGTHSSYSDIKTVQLPGSFNASGDWVVTSGTYSIHGQLTVNPNTVMNNVTLDMDQGASIRIESGKILSLKTCTLRAGCGKMWLGIVCDDGSTIKAKSNTLINDAQYGMSMTGTVNFDFSAGGLTCTNNYTGIYAPPNAAQNHPMMLTTGIQYIKVDWTSNLLPGFYMQNPTPQMHSYAGFLLNDVPTFNNFLSASNYLEIKLTNLILGFAAFRSNITLPEKFSTTHINPASPAEYTWSNAYNGSAVYCSAITGVPKTLSIGSNINSLNQMEDCKYGVHVFNNMNLWCKNNAFLAINGQGGVRVRSCGGRNIDIVENFFFQEFNIAIYCNQISKAILHIDFNEISNGTNYSTFTGSLAHTAIYVHNKAKGTVVYGYIRAHKIHARIGIYLSNVSGESKFVLFEVYDNTPILEIPDGDLISNPTWNHYGLWLENTSNVYVHDNHIYRLTPVPNTTGFPTFNTRVYGCNVKTCGFNTRIINNDFTDMGSFFQVTGDCAGTIFWCNTSSLSSVTTGNYNNTRGFYLYFCKLLNQGGISSPSDNKWFFGSDPNFPKRLQGTVLTPGFTWYYRNSPNEFIPTPYTVAGPFSPGLATGTGPCGGNSPLNDEEIAVRVHDIVYDLIEYDFYPEESRYNDLLWAFDVLADDEALRNSNPDYLQFYSDHQEDNVGAHHDVTAFMSRDDYEAALERLNEMTDQNVIDHNFIFTGTIAAEMGENPDRILTSAEITELRNIAYMNIWEGGEGVINARVQLDLEMEDVPNFYRLAQNGNLPQSHPGNVLMEEKVTVYNCQGIMVFAGTEKEFKATRNIFSEGIYLIKYLYRDKTKKTHIFIK